MENTHLFERNLGGGGFKDFYFHPYLGKMIQFDEHTFEMGWFNHQPEMDFDGSLKEHPVFCLHFVKCDVAETLRNTHIMSVSRQYGPNMLGA